MLVEHLALDGSVVGVEGDEAVTLETPATAAGWVMVPSLLRSHPFTAHPPDHAAIMERAVREHVAAATFADEVELELQGGTLRILVVSSPTATGGTKTMTVGAWQSPDGCFATSILGADADELAAMFNSLRIESGRRGVYLDTPLVAEPRAPEVIKEIPEIGVLSIRPKVSAQLRRFPRASGARVAGGELFRLTSESTALALLTETAVADLLPFAESGADEIMSFATHLRITWAQRPQSW